MTGEHTINIHVTAASPRWGASRYRWEQNYNFTVPDRASATEALACVADLAQQLRNPPRDAVPERGDNPPAEPAADQGTGDAALERLRTALHATEQQYGGPPMGDETFAQRTQRMAVFLEHLSAGLG